MLMFQLSPTFEKFSYSLNLTHKEKCEIVLVGVFVLNNIFTKRNKIQKTLFCYLTMCIMCFMITLRYTKVTTNYVMRISLCVSHRKTLTHCLNAVSLSYINPFLYLLFDLKTL